MGTARSGRSARERLLDAANEPFNAESVQTVGIDAVGVVLILLAVAAIGGYRRSRVSLRRPDPRGPGQKEWK